MRGGLSWQKPALLFTLFTNTMSEELQNLPSNDAAQDTGTGSEEAKSVPADVPASGEQDTSTEGVHPEGDQTQAGNAANEETFHEEGGKVFKTKDEYIRHVNKQRGAASRLAFEKTKLEQELREKNQLLEKVLSGQKPEQQAKPEESELDDESKQVLAELKKRGGFVSTQEVEEILKKHMSQFEPILKKAQDSEIQEAKAYVDSFIDTNPDALDHYEEILDLMNQWASKGLPGGINQAYFHVTGKAPLAAKPAEKSPVSPVKAAKQAQAGGGSSNASSVAATVKRDFMDTILTST